MFVQVIRGSVKDPAAVKRTFDRWSTDLKPGAEGFLGSTAGVAEDGRAIAIVRFETEETGIANSHRPEQGAWWDEMSKHYEGEVRFYDCPTVQLFSGGGSDAAGFVQTMVYKPSDPEAVLALAKEFDKIEAVRPDLLGGVMAVARDGTVFDTNYFTSEADARKNESKDMPPDVRELFERFRKITGDVEFIDLRDPWLD